MPLRGLPDPSVTTTPVNHRSARPKHSAMPWYAMISISSWCAAMHRCVVRAIASSGAAPSGTKKSAFGWWNCMRLLGLLWVADRRQARGGDRLPVALLFFVRNVKANTLGELGKLFLQD